MATLYGVLEPKITFIHERDSDRIFINSHDGTEKLTEVLHHLGFTSIHDIPTDQRVNIDRIGGPNYKEILSEQNVEYVSSWIVKVLSGTVFYVEFRYYFFHNPKDAMIFKLTFCTGLH